MSEVNDSTTALAQDVTVSDGEATPDEISVPEPPCYLKLREACRETNLAQVRSIIDQNPGVDLNISDPEQSYTPLLEFIASAVMDEDATEAPECVRFFISHGSDANVKDANGWTGLHHCARWNNVVSLAIAKVLLELGVNPSANQRLPPKIQPGTDGESQPHDHDDGCACGQNIGSLLSNAYKQQTGKDLDLGKQDKELDVTPLHHACGYGDNLPAVKLLLEHGAQIDVNDALAGTPLLVAVTNGREDICRLLLSKPGGTVCLSIRDKVGRLPIHHASENGSQSLVAMLVEAGSFVDPVVEGEGAQDNEKGLSPLMLACRNASQDGKLAVIEYLIEHGAGISRVGEKGQTPLLLSVLAKNVDAAKLIAKHGADPKAAVGPFEDVNALHMAATAGAADLCRWLVEDAGIAIESADDQGYTALINAAGYSGSPETIRMLVSTLGADIEARIYDGRRPLHFSAFKGRESCAKELIALGADKEATDDAKWTPLHFAARYHHADVVRLLLSHNAVLGKTVEGGPQPKLVDGEEIDICGFTAADLARVTRGGQECVDILVTAGDPLSESTKDLKDEDLWKDQGGSCCVM